MKSDIRYPFDMKLLCSLLLFVSVVVAQAPFKNLTWSENITSTFAPIGDSNSSTSLLDIFESKTEKFRQVYNNQLEFMRLNRTRNKLIVKFRDAETIEEEPQANGNSIPFFQRILERKSAKLEKLKDLKTKGHDKMVEKFMNWNITGMKQRFYGTRTGVNIVEVEEGVDVESIWSTILQDQEVEFAEVDMTMSLFGSCSLASDWGYRHTRANHVNDVLALLSSNRSQEAQVLVAVIDSGVDYNHPLLTGRVWFNEAELNGADGVDDDGNGYVDDTWGWNFADDTNNVLDFDGHGTHVAGIIAGTETTDPDAFSGVAPNVAILPCRFTESSDTGTVSAAIQCMEYAFEMEADIISNSWGGAGAYSLALEEAMNRASRLGRLQINAAGNSGVDNDGSRDQATYPAAYDTDIIISVAAIDNEGRLTEVSNYGAASVDIGAPGESIWSTRLNGELDRMSGTSQATPYVAAAAAVLLGACRERGRECSALDIKQAILDGAVRDPDLDGRVLSAGYLDIPNAASILRLNVSAFQDRDEADMDVCRGARTVMTRLLVFVCAFTMLVIL